MTCCICVTSVVLKDALIQPRAAPSLIALISPCGVAWIVNVSVFVEALPALSVALIVTVNWPGPLLISTEAGVIVNPVITGAVVSTLPPTTSTVEVQPCSIFRFW